MTTASQPPPKKLKLGLSHPLPKTFKLHHIVDKAMNMSSGSSSVCTSSDSDLELLSSQEYSVSTVLTCITLNVLYCVYNVLTVSTSNKNSTNCISF